MSHYPSPELPSYVDSILDLVEDGIFLSDRNGLTLRVNKAYEQLSGISRNELEGKTVRQLVKDGVFNRILNPLIVKSKKPASVVQEFGSEKKTFHLRGFPILDEAGEVAIVVTFVRDITTINQMREQIAEQNRLIDQYQGRMAQILGAGKRDEGIFASPTMQALLKTLKRIAQTDATVLLLGETGVGKDVLARIVHANSTRKDGVFMKVDCGSIAENLIESELFGYVRGAFSGASHQGKAGYFEMADGGTLFLDEIGELSLSMQTKLLRFLQDHEFMRVGSSTVKKVDVRVIAATNRDLRSGIEEGKFRRDLYYRLNVAKLNVPPLRERKEDIPLLAKHFLHLYNDKYKKHMRLAPQALKMLCAYPWPGNVRELQNLMLQLVITNEQSTLDVVDLPIRLQGGPGDTPALPPAAAPTCEGLRIAPELTDTPRPLKDIVAELEYGVLMEAVKKYGSYSRAAEMLEINRSTLFRKLKRFNPDMEQDSGADTFGE